MKRKHCGAQSAGQPITETDRPTLVGNQQLRGQCIFFKRSLGMHANLEKLDLLMPLFIWMFLSPVAPWLQKNETAPKNLNETRLDRAAQFVGVSCAANCAPISPASLKRLGALMLFPTSKCCIYQWRLKNLVVVVCVYACRGHVYPRSPVDQRTVRALWERRRVLAHTLVILEVGVCFYEDKTKGSAAGVCVCVCVYKCVGM